MKNNVSILAKDAPFPVWYGEPFKISKKNIGGSVLFMLEAPLEEYKKALSSGVGCVLPILDDNDYMKRRELVNYNVYNKSVPFCLSQISSDIGEVLYCGTGSFIYAQVKSRTTSFFHTNDSGKAIYSWLKRRFRKKLAKGGGLKDAVSVRLCESSFVCDHVVPVGLRSPSDLVIQSHSFVYENVLDYISKKHGGDVLEELMDKNIRILIEEMAFIKSLEKSDTPVWITPSDDLTVMLLNTQPSVISESDVRFIAPAIFIEFQKGVFGIDSGDGGLVIGIDGVFLYEGFDDRGDRFLFIGFMSVFGEALCIRATYFSFSELVKAIVSTRKTYGNEIDVETDLPWRIYGKKVGTGVFLRKMSCFLLNILLYISNQSSPIKRSVVRREIKVKTKDKKKKKKRKEKIGISLYEELVIGTEVVLSSEDKEIMKRSASEGWKISYSFLVRGHWRNQVCGPGRSLRKQKWIEPYVKGKDLASRIVGHSYVDKKTSEQAQSAGR